MKKVVSFFIAAVLSFSFCLSAFAVDLSKVTGFVDKTVTIPKTSITFDLSAVLNFVCDYINDYLETQSKKIEAARAYYFYKIMTDGYYTGKTVYNSESNVFFDDYLEYYFEQVWISSRQSIFHQNNTIYDSEGDIFLRAAGFNDERFNLSMLNFCNRFENQAYRNGQFVETKDKDDYFIDFKNYYNTLLARFLISINYNVTDPNPGKSGLEIAPAYVTSDELAESLELDNTFYFPRNDYRLVSYRNDPTFQRLVKFKATNNNMSYSPTIKYEDKFLYGSSGNDLYFVLYADVDEDLRGYGVYQYRLNFEDVKNEEGTVVKRVPHLFRWNVVSQSEDEAVEVSSSVTNGLLNFSDTANCKYVRCSFENKILKLFCYNTFDDFMNNNSSYCYYRFNLETDNLDCFSRDMSTRFSYLTCNSSQHFFMGSYEKHAENCSSTTDDIGYICSGSPILLNSYPFDITRIPKGQIVTINGDTIYNYTITNPETGDSSKFGDYITNNYTYITNNNGGSSSGNVTVGGKIDVGGSVAVDVNVNVNGGVGDNTSLPDVDIANNLPEAPQGFIDYLTSLFSFLPASVLLLIIGGISAAIFCRVWGR